MYIKQTFGDRYIYELFLLFLSNVLRVVSLYFQLFSGVIRVQLVL